MLTALVTGPTSGIGRVSALELARLGHHVILASRSVERARPVLESILASGGSGKQLDLDLASLASVRRAAAAVIESGNTIDVLVNNAGIGINRRGLTDDGFEVHFGINHLGHFLLTRELLPSFRPGTRVLSVASDVHVRARGIDFTRVRRPTPLLGLAEYAVSKLANVLFVRELARRHPQVNSYAVHPGLVRTPLIPAPVRALAGTRMLTPEQGADTVVWCATSPEVADESGHYYRRRALAIPSAAAQDDDLARELWERSETWCS